MTTTEVADLLGTSGQQVSRWCRWPGNALPHRKKGRLYIVDREVLRAWLRRSPARDRCDPAKIRQFVYEEEPNKGELP